MEKGIDGASRALRVANGPDGIHIQFSVKDAARIAVRLYEVFGRIEDGLAGARSLIFGGNHHEAPGSHVGKQICNLARSAEGSVTPSQNRMLEAVCSEIRGIEDIVLMVSGIATGKPQ